MKLFDQVLSPIIEVLHSFSGEQTEELVLPTVNNVFGFYSPSGGVGITTFIVNLAAVLAAHKTVAILDLDVLHPGVYNYLVRPNKDGVYIKEDLTERFIASGQEIVKYSTDTIISNVKLFSCLPEGDIIKYLNLDYDAIRNSITDLSRMYDFVLVDIKGNLFQDTVVAAIDVCTRVYTFIRPWMSDVMRVHKEIALLKRYGFGAKLRNIIQCPVSEAPLEDSALKEIGLVPVLKIPFVKRVEDVGFNFQIFVLADGDADKYSKSYLKCVTWLAERIANFETEEVSTNGSNKILLDKPDET